MSPLEAMQLLPAAVLSTAMLGGGALRSARDGTPVKDYDLFFRDAAAWDAAVTDMRAHPDFEETMEGSGPLYPMFVHKFTEAKFNLIGLRFFDNLKDLAESFDFLCCGFALSVIPGRWPEVHHVAGAAEAAASKTLSIQNPQSHTRLIRRAGHYINDYGYTPDDDCREAIETGAFRGAVLPRHSSLSYGG